jgi:hypothetical protein
MSENLLLELEEPDTLAQDLEKIEGILRGAREEVGRIMERMKGAGLTFENAWRQIVAKVAKGQTMEMHAVRSRLLSAFEKRFDLFKQGHSLLSGYYKQGWTELPNPDDFLTEIAAMDRWKARVLDRWQTAEDLEDLAARDYPLTTADLDRIGPKHQPPSSWYAEESKPF